MRRLLASAVALAMIGAFVVLAGGASNGPSDPTYKIEFDNAFGLVTGAPFKVAGVPAGKIESITLDPRTLHAVVKVEVTQRGFGSFHSSAFCQSRPQSLIGEYFVDCQPGQSGPVLASGSTIPASHTFSTIPGDLLLDIMQMPYRERLSLIINELGGAVAARSEDLQTALERADPALSETDSLLGLLASDSHTLQQLTAGSDSVITALANNNAQVQRFIVEANDTATDTSTQDANLESSLAQLPGFLQQLRPAMAKLGSAAEANEPVLANLNAASGTLDRLLVDLPAFKDGALPALKSLGQASITGKQAVQAATPTVKALNQFAQPTPELAQNLAIVLQSLDTQSNAVEPDPRSPSGKGFSGLEALLQYVFNQTLAVNTFGPDGHMLTVDAFASPMCSAYATPQTIANNLAQYGAAYRQCYSWLGPNQPGVNETDPSDPSACVPDPGGAPPGEQGPATSACRLAASVSSAGSAKPGVKKSGAARPKAATTGSKPSPAAAAPSAGGGAKGPLPGLPLGVSPGSLGSTLGQVLSEVGGTAGSALSKAASPTPNAGTPLSGSSSSSAGGGTASQAQQLLSYLLSP